MWFGIGEAVAWVLPLSVLALLVSLVALCVAIWLSLRRLRLQIDNLATIVKSLGELRPPEPAAVATSKVRYTKGGAAYVVDPIHGSRFVKKERP